MRIEMTGPPTSGKSSLVKALKAAGICRGVVDPLFPIPNVWKGFADFIDTVYANTTYKKLPGKTITSLTSAWKGSKRKGWAVFDELLILCGFSLAIRMPEYAEEYFQTVPLPELLIIMTAPNDVLMLRNEKRGEKNRPEKTMRCVVAHKKYLPILKERGCTILKINSSKRSANK